MEGLPADPGPARETEAEAGGPARVGDLPPRGASGAGSGRGNFAFDPRQIGLAAFFVLLTLYVISQLWISWQVKSRSEAVLRELEAMKASSFSDEKARQEAISLRIENERRTMFLQTFLANFNTTTSVIVAVFGAWLAFQQYVGVRQRERLDRASNDLTALWKGITSQSQNERAGSFAGLLHYLRGDMKDYHSRVAAALALAGRLDNDSTARRTLRPIVEEALRTIPEEMRGVSWQGLKMPRGHLVGQDLAGFDLRDADLQGTDLTGARLGGARLNAASFVACKLEGADLSGADLEYADFGNASLKGASLAGANLRNIKVLDADFDRADLSGAMISEFLLDWKLAKNWRKAKLDDDLRGRLLARYGPAVSGPRVLMLLWEFAPIIAGGVWTAAYHLLLDLRRRGVDLVVMVPWPASAIETGDFGNEVEIIAVGREAQTKPDAYSSYSSLRSSSYSSVYFNVESGDSQTVFEQVHEFSRRALESIRERGLAFDVVYAHDWITFGAAEAIASDAGKPWIAHFHSTEADRRDTLESAPIRRIEADACRGAARLVVPSEVTRSRLVALYQAPADRIVVVPNVLSPSGSQRINTGDFGSMRVVFVGRLSAQKGPDHFVEIARLIRAELPETRFVLYGRGELEPSLRGKSDIVTATIPPPQVVPGRPRGGLVSSYEIDDLFPASFDPATGKIGSMGAYSEAKKKAVIDRLIEVGFSARSLPPEVYPAYTHLAEAAVSGDGFQPYYVLQVTGLPQTTVSRQRLLEFGGFKAWAERGRAFENASLVVVPSRNEPFGMVVLEAMQHGVPVAFAKTAGVGEVVKAGVRIDPEDHAGTARDLVAILKDPAAWQRLADDGLAEIADYPARGYETRLIAVFEDLSGKKVAGAYRPTPAERNSALVAP